MIILFLLSLCVCVCLCERRRQRLTIIIIMNHLIITISSWSSSSSCHTTTHIGSFLYNIILYYISTYYLSLDHNQDNNKNNGSYKMCIYADTQTHIITLLCDDDDVGGLGLNIIVLAQSIFYFSIALICPREEPTITKIIIVVVCEEIYPHS
jgi:hypothetical protein